MIEAHRARTGEHLTYQMLAKRTGLSRSTLESMATRKGYNASLSSIERLCLALHCSPADLLVLEQPLSPKSKGRRS